MKAIAATMILLMLAVIALTLDLSREHKQRMHWQHEAQELADEQDEDTVCNARNQRNQSVINYAQRW